MMRYFRWSFVLLVSLLAAASARGELSARLGRFLQSDPNSSGLSIQDNSEWFHGQSPMVQLWAPELSARLRNGANLFQYAGGNPVSRSDPLGLSYDMFDDVIEIAQEHTFSGLYGVQMALGHAQSELKKIQAYTKAAFQWDDMVRDRDESILIGLVVGPFLSRTCFEAGTPVVGADGTEVAIEDIELGDALFSTRDPMAIGASGLMADPDTSESIDPTHWRKITIEASNESGAHVVSSLLRPLAWIDAANVKAGGSLQIDFDELNLAGPAWVRSIEPCPTMPRMGSGAEAVTGLFKTESASIVRVWLFGSSQSIGVTPSHRFYCHDTHEWTPAAELKTGQRVRTIDGYASVVRVEDYHETTAVYNIEVRRRHTYYAGTARAWVHNTYSNRPQFPNRTQKPTDVKSWIYETAVSMRQGRQSSTTISNYLTSTIRTAGFPNKVYTELVKYIEYVVKLLP